MNAEQRARGIAEKIYTDIGLDPEDTYVILYLRQLPIIQKALLSFREETINEVNKMYMDVAKILSEGKGESKEKK